MLNLFCRLADRIAFSKGNILKHKRSVQKGAIYDQEIEVEMNWLLRKVTQKELKKAKDQIAANLKEIEEEKAKTPMDMEKIKKLIGNNVTLGFASVDNEGVVSYQEFTSNDRKNRKLTKVGRLENVLEGEKRNIIDSVFKRELMKKQLAAIDELIRKGYHHDFERFRDEYLTEFFPEL